MKKLNYHSEWNECPILTDDLLESQIKKYNIGTDTGTEHYRYQSFIQYLQKKDFNKTDFDIYIKLTDIDDDRSMASSAMFNIFIKNKFHAK